MKPSGFPFRPSFLQAALLSTTMLPLAAATVYWDTNGGTAGSGNVGGAWDSGTNWSADPTGASATAGWTNGDSAVFSAGTDGIATTARTITLAGEVFTPSILLEESGPINLTGGSINITGGSIFNSAALGATTGRSMTWTSAITGTGPLTLAANGDLSATGGGSSTVFALTGTNTFTGDVTITSGVVSTASNFGNAANKIILNGGGLVDPNLNSLISRNIEIGTAGGVIRNYGSVTNLRLAGTLTGSGELRRTDGGTTILTGDGTGFTGALNVQRGTMQIGSGTQTTNLLSGTSGITIGDSLGAATFRYQLDGSITHSAPVTFGNATSVFQWLGTGNDDVLTLNAAMGGNTTMGILRASSGGITLASGADVKVNQVSLTLASGLQGTLNVLPGASLTTKFLNVGDGSSTSGIVNQSGGTVTVESGSNGVRIGHWANGASPGSVYNLTGGTLDVSASGVPLNVGWDGAGTLNVSGTGTAKAWRLYVDASGVDVPGIVNLNAGGTIEVGAGGTLNDGTAGSQINLGGGKLKSMASSTWASRMNTTAASTTTLEGAAGSVTSITGVLTGTGDIQQTGAGEFAYNSASPAFTGNLTSNAGSIISGTGTLPGNVTVNGTIAPGLSSTPAVAGNLTLGDSSAVSTTTTLNGLIQLDLNAASTSTGNDLIAVNDNLTFGASNLIRPNIYGGAAVSGSTYTLLTYTGTLSGTPVLDPLINGTSRQVYTLDTTQANKVNLGISGVSASLAWAGNAGGNIWDVNSTATWLNAATPDKFFQNDAVSFTDSGVASVPVVVSGTVNPGTLSINSSQNYTFTGGLISGGPALNKSGAGSATFENNLLTSTVNINAGNTTFLSDLTATSVTVSGGNLTFGNGGTTGSLSGIGNITLASGATLTFNRSDATTLSRAFTAGSTGTLIKEGTGNLTTSGFFLLPTNLTVNAGTFTMNGGTFSGNRMDGSGLITVNPTGTLVLNGAHAAGGDNGTMTDALTVNGGKVTFNNEQYFANLILNNGALLDGAGELRATNTTNWQVTGTTASTISARVSHVGTASWNVSDVTASAAPDLVITGAISNTGGLNKSGSGTLRASGNNSFNGSVNISAGTFQAASNNALGFGGAIGNTPVNGTSVTGGATLDINGASVTEVITLNDSKLINSNTTTASTLVGGVAGIRVSTVGAGYTVAPTVALSGGGGSGATATSAFASSAVSSFTTSAAGSGYTSAPTVTLSGGGTPTTVATATATIASLNLTGTANQIGGDGNLTLNSIITGTGSFTKIGSGTLTLGTAASTFSGNPIFNQGITNVAVQGNATTSAFGSQSSTRTVTVSGGSTVNFNTNNVLGAGGIAAGSLPAFTVGAGSTLASNNYNVLGALNLSGGTLTVNRTGTPGSYQGFELKGPVTTSGAAQSVITSTNGYGHHLVGNINFNVGESVEGTDLLVSAPLRNSSGDNGSAVASLTKSGPGTMSLNADNTYTGTTTVSAGTLVVNGSLGAGAVTVESDATLGGGSATPGAIGGMVTVHGILAPGNSPGTLAIAGNLFLDPASTLNWELNATSMTLGGGINDLTTVGGQLTLDGTLNVSGIGSFAGLTSGSWTLFTYGSLVDNSLSLGTLPALDSGLNWEVSTAAGQVNLAIVPEPTTTFLGALGLLFLSRRRRAARLS